MVKGTLADIARGKIAVHGGLFDGTVGQPDETTHDGHSDTFQIVLVEVGCERPGDRSTQVDVDICEITLLGIPLDGRLEDVLHTCLELDDIFAISFVGIGDIAGISAINELQLGASYGTPGFESLLESRYHLCGRDTFVGFGVESPGNETFRIPLKWFAIGLLEIVEFLCMCLRSEQKERTNGYDKNKTNAFHETKTSVCCRGVLCCILVAL